jgi:hypothetical protein
MKMTKKFLCCDDCFADICKKDIHAARLWLEICEIYNKAQNIFGIKLPDFTELSTLEHMGFIVTTDKKDHLLLKVNGIHEDKQGTYFCINGSHNA